MAWNKMQSGFYGDEPVAILDQAIQHLILLWTHNWGRRPNENELKTAWFSALNTNIDNKSVYPSSVQTFEGPYHGKNQRCEIDQNDTPPEKGIFKKER